MRKFLSETPLGRRLAALLALSGPTMSGLWLGVAIALVHGTNGAIEPNWNPHLPTIQARFGIERLDLADLILGLAMFAMPVGLWLSNVVGSRLVPLIGTRRTFAIGGLLFFAPLPLFALVGSPWALVAVAFVIGFGNGLWDLVQGMLATWYERGRGHRWPLAFTACFSVASLVFGAGTAWLAAHFHWSMGWHLSIVAVIAFAASVVVGRHLPELHDETAPKTAIDSVSIWRARRLALAALAAMIVLGAAYTWSSSHLKRLGAEDGDITLGLVAFTLMQAAMQLVAFGLSGKQRGRTLTPVAQVYIGAGVAAAGCALLAAAAFASGASLGFAIAGWAAVGLGLAPIQALALSVAAERAAEGAQTRTVALITRYTYAGVMASPTVVGAVSALIGLQYAIPATFGLCLALIVAVGWTFRLESNRRLQPAESGTFAGPAEWVLTVRDRLPGVALEAPDGPLWIPLHDASFRVIAADGRVAGHQHGRPEGALGRWARRLREPVYSSGPQTGRTRTRALPSVPGQRQTVRGARHVSYAIDGPRVSIVAIEGDPGPLRWEALRPVRPSSLETVRRRLAAAVRWFAAQARRWLALEPWTAPGAGAGKLVGRTAAAAAVLAAGALLGRSAALGALAVLMWACVLLAARRAPREWQRTYGRGLASWLAVNAALSAALFVSAWRLTGDGQVMDRLDGLLGVAVAAIALRSTWPRLRAALAETREAESLVGTLMASAQANGVPLDGAPTVRRLAGRWRVEARVGPGIAEVDRLRLEAELEESGRAEFVLRPSWEGSGHG